MPFQPDDIAVKQFLVRARGFDREEVAAFLRAVAADYGQALAALEASPAPLADGGEPGAPVDTDVSDRRKTLKPYRVDTSLMRLADKDALFMH